MNLRREGFSFGKKEVILVAPLGSIILNVLEIVSFFHRRYYKSLNKQNFLEERALEFLLLRLLSYFKNNFKFLFKSYFKLHPMIESS